MTKKVSTFFKILSCLVLMAFLMPQQATAQRRVPMNLPKYDYEPYHFGFILAYNQMLYSIEFIDNYQNIVYNPGIWPDAGQGEGHSDEFVSAIRIESPIRHGFTVGVVGNLRLGKYFDLRLIPSLSYGERRLKYYLYRSKDPFNPEVETPELSKPVYDSITKNTHSVFVEFPLQVKYRSKRLNNIAAYVISGLNYKIDLASQKSRNDNDKIVNIKVRRTDIAAEVGAGFDFYTGYFKFGVEIKMSYGLLDILDKENVIFSSSFDKLHNKMFQLSFTFE